MNLRFSNGRLSKASSFGSLFLLIMIMVANESILCSHELDQWFMDNCQDFDNYLENMKTLRGHFPDVPKFRLLYQLMDLYEQDKCPPSELLKQIQDVFFTKSFGKPGGGQVIREAYSLYMQKLRPICDGIYNEKNIRPVKRSERNNNKLVEEVRASSGVDLEKFRAAFKNAPDPDPSDAMRLFRKFIEIAKSDPASAMLEKTLYNNEEKNKRCFDLLQKHILEPCSEFEKQYPEKVDEYMQLMPLEGEEADNLLIRKYCTIFCQLHIQGSFHKLLSVWGPIIWAYVG